MFPLSWVIAARQADVATIVDENVNGVRVVKSFAAEERQIASLAGAAERLRWANVSQADARAKYAPFMENLPRLGLAAVLLYGGWLAIDGQVTIGTLVAFNAYVVLLQTPFRMLGFFLMMTQRAAASAGRIYEILDEVPQVQRPPRRRRPGRSGRAHRARDVTFRYGDDGPDVLDGLDLTIEAGRDRRPRRAHGQWQVDRGPTGPPLLRRDRRCGPGRRPRRPRPDRAQPAGGRGHRPRRAVPVLGADPGQHRLRPTRRHRRGGRGGRPGRAGPRLHQPAGRRLRHGRRRAGLHAVRRPAPAHRPRPHPPGRPADPGPRRRHQCDRRARRGGHPRRARSAHWPTGRRSSSPTGCRPSPWPTGSSSSTAAGWWPPAPTPSCWPPSPATRDVLAHLDEEEG